MDIQGRIFWNGPGWYASRVEGDSGMEVMMSLGEAMAEACGKDYESMKGMASGVAKRLRGAHPAPRSRQEQQEEPCTPYMH